MMNSSRLLTLWLFIISLKPSLSFQPLSNISRRPSSSSWSTLYMSQQQADFEYQEMRAQLDAMKKAGVPSRDLSMEKRQELEQYVRQVATLRPSPVALPDIGKVLPQTKWRLAFSTEGATLGDLPRDANVYLEFVDDERLDYILQFSQKTLGLDKLVAKSTYTVDTGPVNPGLVTFIYDQITTDIFGIKNMSVGFFGLLKGRANYVESNFFDGRFWIERGFSPDGNEYFNVYVREEEN